ncbi:MAG: response regulator [Candidatus Doudnabacteria bacterium]
MAKKIIIIDDDFVQRDLYREIFHTAGFEVTTATDGLDGWEKIQKNTPDIIGTGIQMPHMSGFELVEKLRANKSTKTTPVIIFSHLGRPEDRAKAKSYPFVEFVVKGQDRPVDILHKAQDMLLTRNPQTPALNPDEDDRQGFTIL